MNSKVQLPAPVFKDPDGYCFVFTTIEAERKGKSEACAYYDLEMGLGWVTLPGSRNYHAVTGARELQFLADATRA